MAGFVAGTDRGQAALLPECLDDWVDDSNPVRVIDAFVEMLNLRDLGFTSVDPADTGRPAYHPSIHLKLYIYGYLNRVHSSRRLEREAGRNVEDHVALGPAGAGLQDDRRFPQGQWAGDQKSLRALRRGVPRDGIAGEGQRRDRFKAVNNRDKNFTQAKVERRRKQLEESVARYLAQLDTADRQVPSEVVTLKKMRYKEKLEKLQSEMAKLAAIEKQVLASPDQQVSFTDPDSRSMATSGRGSGVVGYNVQAAVDTENHLIVAHEVTNVGSDRSQLANTAQAAKEALQVEKLDAVADRGYFNGEQIKACADAGVTVTL